MSTDNSTFKINSAQELNVSKFFEETEFANWSIENYYAYIRESNSSSKVNSVIQMYANDLDKLMKCDELPNTITCSLGHLKQQAKSFNPKNPENSAVVYNSGVLYTNNRDCNFSNATIYSPNRQQEEVEVSHEQNKKRKISLINNDGCWNIDNNEEFWQSWQEHLDQCECHEYCLETYHIIECGYTIKCKPSYDKGLYEQFGDINNTKIKSPFMTYPKYTTDAIGMLNEPNERKFMMKLFNEEHWELIDNGNRSAKYVFDFFKLIKKYISHGTTISNSESMYNHYLVWPMIDLAKTTAGSLLPTDFGNLLFQTGEIILDSSDENFKADGLIEINGIEFCLLETSGAYDIKDDNRFSGDHVKGAFGVLTFLRKILKTFHFATEETLRELIVVFVHARGKYVHLWSMEMPTKDVQVFEHLLYTEIPQDASETEKVLDLGNFVWKLSECIQKSCSTITKMKKEHKEYLVSRELDPDQPERLNLSTLVKNTIQKPVKGSGYGVILPQQIDICKTNKKVVKQ